MNTKSLLAVGYSDCQNSNLEKSTSLNRDSSALVEVLPGYDIYSYDGDIPLSNENAAATLRTSARLFSKKNRESLFPLSFSGHGALACRFHLFLDLMFPVISAAMSANGGEAAAYAKPNTRQAGSMILKRGVPIARTPGARTESSAIY